MNPNTVANTIGSAISQFGNYSAQAAARANGVSAGAQAAQGNFNQASVNNANAITTDRIAEQYSFNAAQAAAANAFTSQMWDKSAAWNEDMWERMAEFNAAEAQKNRDWQERMMSTAYQRAVKDMETAGLNPILAVTGGGISTGSGGGSAASAGAPSMSGATGYAASGGLTSGLAASEGNYSGQMEYMGGLLGLLSAGIGGISSALSNFGGLGEAGAAIAKAISDIFNDDRGERAKDYVSDISNTKSDIYKNNAKTIGEMLTGNHKNYYGKYGDTDNGYNRYYNPTSKYYIGNR